LPFKSWHVSGRMFSITSKVAEKRQRGFCYMEFRCRWPSKTTRAIKSHIRTYVSRVFVWLKVYFELFWYAIDSYGSNYISNRFKTSCIRMIQSIFRIVLICVVFCATNQPL
jgi:hypothetical protein